MRPFRAVCFIFLTCVFVQVSFAGTGVIKAASTEEDDCPTSVAATVYERADPRSKVLGAIADGNSVRLDLNTQAGEFYWVQGDGYSGKLSGYVYKTCVTVTSTDDPPRSRTLVVPIKPSTAASGPPPVQCTEFTEFVPGCKSFNDMLAAQDKDVLRSLTGSNQTYVCFRTGQDVFTVVSFEKTDDLYSFKTVAGTGMAETSGFTTLTRYKEGVSEDYQPFWGKWRKPAAASNDAAYFTGGGPALRPFSISIDNSEVSVSYKWKNVSKTITTYTLQIRRSTKRGLETLEAPHPPTDKDKSTFLTTFHDFCEYYPNQ